MTPAGPRGLHEQVARPLCEELPQHLEPVRTVDVDPQKPGLGDRVLGTARLVARAHADEHLLPRAAACARPCIFTGRDPPGVLEQLLQPAPPTAGATREVMLRPRSPIDVESPIRISCAGGQL